LTDWHLLVVDDEDLNLEIIGMQLEDGPYRLQNASTGEVALACLADAANPVDLVILDRMLPGINGIDVLRWIRADARHRRTPVVMQTAAARSEDIAEGLAAGAHYYLVKPFLSGALIGIVNAALHDLAKERMFVAAMVAGGIEPVQEGCEYRFASIAEADALAIRLAAGHANPADLAVALGELMENAIEHGVAGLGYAEKSGLLGSGKWQDELDRRLAAALAAGRDASVSFRRAADGIEFIIGDPGEGFDWQRFLAFDAARICDPNGRGIARAVEHAFGGRLRYEVGGGCRAIASLRA
jgi:DNA-binding response OmpR family regulator